MLRFNCSSLWTSTGYAVPLPTSDRLHAAAPMKSLIDVANLADDAVEQLARHVHVAFAVAKDAAWRRLTWHKLLETSLGAQLW